MRTVCFCLDNHQGHSKPTHEIFHLPTGSKKKTPGLRFPEESRYVLRIRDYPDPFLFFSDGIGTRKILFHQEGLNGFLGFLSKEKMGDQVLVALATGILPANN